MEAAVSLGSTVPATNGTTTSNEQPVASTSKLPSTLPITAPTPNDISLKRRYLSLLEHSHLIDLVMSLDANRQAPIFPPDLPAAIHGIHVHNATIKSAQQARPMSYPQAAYYNPPTTHTPIHAPLFTSAPLPLVRGPTSSTSPAPLPLPKSVPMPIIRPPTQLMSREDIPSYEEMLVEALVELGDPGGAPPKTLFAWMSERYPLQQNFRPSASQALQKAFKRGRFDKSADGRYRLNPHWEGGVSSKRANTRRLQPPVPIMSGPNLPPQGTLPPVKTKPPDAQAQARAVLQALTVKTEVEEEPDLSNEPEDIDPALVQARLAVQAHIRLMVTQLDEMIKTGMEEG